MKKRLRILMVVGVLSLASTMTSMASWEQQADGAWKYSENNIFLTGWQWIDGNNDNIAECYYLDGNGVLAINTVVDSYTVNETGAWTVNNVVQTKEVNISSGSGQKESSTKNESGSNDTSSSNHQSSSGIPSLDDIMGNVGSTDWTAEGGDSTGLPPMH